MVAEPATARGGHSTSEGNEEQVGDPDLVQHAVTIRVAGDVADNGAAERSTEPIQDRGPQQEPALFFRQGAQHFFGQDIPG